LAEWRKRSHPNPLPFCPLASTPAERARRL
jgi:hypothetical protein